MQTSQMQVHGQKDAPPQLACASNGVSGNRGNMPAYTPLAPLDVPNFNTGRLQNYKIIVHLADIPDFVHFLFLSLSLLPLFLSFR